ncbi:MULTISPECIES: helix-turn-helix domain-containing protein [Lysinibacillus]|uniref:helix-turn-helix domain-containing protein n=1 Tax=Lysinibacillus TaxID=400634 RepID=UPI00214B67AE|nr:MULTISPECIES: helix-turn-helix transcriptional regulator [Lysinibacillus]UUV23644.1 helix-turn-helix transcriptional regulator [Lysinibacillus sp. FN11]UYB46515.1 helix-turn-helix transcriptional regulator [Lysinibacillus capsici]
MDTLASRIKYLRKAHSMNQSTFAKEIQISQASLSDIEKGKSKPSLDTLNNISEQFGVSTDWLIKGDTRLAAQYSNSDMIQEIMEIIPQQLSENKLELISKFNLDKKIVNAVYNAYFLKLILTSLTSDEKSFLEVFLTLNPAARKETLAILKAIHLNEDVQNNDSYKNEA